MKIIKKVICSLLCLTTLIILNYGVSKAATEYTDNVIPVMTSENTPEGSASSSSFWSGSDRKFPAWKAFDHKCDTTFNGWATESGTVTGWLSYEFAKEKCITKYTIVSRNPITYDIYITSMPKNWTFEAWDAELQKWVVLDKQTDITNWEWNLKKEFTFSNKNSYKKYRLNISDNCGYLDHTELGELEMMETKTTSTDFDGNRAKIQITMVTGEIKEFDYSIDVIQDFVDWYDQRSDGNGKSYYIFKKDKHNPYISRREYLAYDKISSFEIQDYNE